jgi:hypothetical protein
MPCYDRTILYSLFCCLPAKENKQMKNTRIVVEYIQAREDEIARMITAIEQVELIRQVFTIMQRDGSITDAEFEESTKAIDFIVETLRVSKTATATLRNNSREYSNKA